jgi:hypothetical protein
MSTRSLIKLYIKFDGVCQLCMKPCKFTDATRDHIVPRSRGGIGLPNNLQLAHYACNKLKADLDAIPSLEERQANNRRKRLLEKVKKEKAWLRSLVDDTHAEFIKCPYCRHNRLQHNMFGCSACQCESWAT